MLCDRCQHQETCFLPQLAAHDTDLTYQGDRVVARQASQQIQRLLDKLQVCELYVARFPHGLSWASKLNKLRRAGRMRLAEVKEGIYRLFKGHCLTE